MELNERPGCSGYGGPYLSYMNEHYAPLPYDLTSYMQPMSHAEESRTGDPELAIQSVLAV